MKRLTLIPEPGQIKEISFAFGSVEKEIRQSLLKFELDSFNEIEAIKMQGKLNRMLDVLEQYSARWARRSTLMTYTNARSIARTRLEILGAERDPGFDQLKRKNSITNFAAILLRDLRKAVQSMRQYIKSYVYFARKSHEGIMQIQAFGFSLFDEEIIAGIIEETIALKMARGYASKKIADYLKKNLHDGKFILVGNRTYNVNDYAKLVARTRLAEAQTKATKQACEEYQNDLVQFSRHANPCGDCLQYEGNIYSLSGRHPSYPMLPEEPPIHCNCEHSISPTSEVAIKYREKYS